MGNSKSIKWLENDIFAHMARDRHPSPPLPSLDSAINHLRGWGGFLYAAYSERTHCWYDGVEQHTVFVRNTQWTRNRSSTAMQNHKTLQDRRNGFLFAFRFQNSFRKCVINVIKMRLRESMHRKQMLQLVYVLRWVTFNSASGLPINMEPAPWSIFPAVQNHHHRR